MIGQTLAGRYEVQKELGRGGMGKVYLAYDPVLEREVAIKYLSSPPSETLARRRFLKEARLIAQMNHPNIVQIFDFYPKEENPFFVMPVLRGQTLRHLLQRTGILSLDETFSLGIQISLALEHSHAMGVIHRDIKPENIFLTPTDNSFHVRVLDFGVALLSADVETQNASGVTGTFWYLSPEQLTGGLVDERSDLYGLGSVLYECLSGTPPFHGDVQAMFQKVSTPQPPALHRLLQTTASAHGTPWTDPELSFFDQIMRCLQRDPEKRFSSARAFRRAFVIEQNKAAQGFAEASPTYTPAPPSWLSEPHTPLPSLPTDPNAPLCIGRDSELKELLSQLDQASTGHCHMTLLTGAKGTGKTHLTQTLSWAAPHSVLHLRGDCRNTENHPFKAFGDLLEAYCTHHATNPKILEETLGPLAPALCTLFPTLELQRATTDSETHSPHTREQIQRLQTGHQGEVVELLAVALQRICERQPLVAVLESIEASTASLGALHYIYHRLQRSPLLLLATSHKVKPLQELLNSLSASVRFSQIHLGSLTQDNQLHLLHTLAPNSTLAQRRAWASRTDGTPGQLMSILDNGVSPDTDTFPPEAEIEQPYTSAFAFPEHIELPGSVETRIAEETLDELPALMPFQLEQFATHPPPRLGPEAVTPPPPSLPSISVGIMPDAGIATPTMPLFATSEHIEHQNTEMPQIAEQLGDLLLIQGKYLAARDAYHTAQRERKRSGSRFSYVKEAYTLRKLALINYSLGHYDETLALCQEGLGLVDELAPMAAASLEAWCSLACTAAGELGEAQRWYELGFARTRQAHAIEANPPLGEDLGSAAVESLLFRAKGNAQLGRCQPLEAILSFRKGLEKSEQTQDEWEYSIALHNLGEAYNYTGQHKPALDYCWQALKTKAALGDRWGLAQTHCTFANIYIEQARWEEAHHEAQQGLHLAKEVSDPKLNARAHLLQASLQRREGDFEATQQTLMIAMEEAQRAFAKSEWIAACVQLAHLYLSQNNPERAEPLAREAESIVLSLDSPQRQSEVQRLWGHLWVVLDKPDKATRHFERAAMLCQTVLAPFWCVQQLASIANAMNELGHFRKAAEILNCLIDISLPLDPGEDQTQRSDEGAQHLEAYKRKQVATFSARLTKREKPKDQL